MPEVNPFECSACASAIGGAVPFVKVVFSWDSTIDRLCRPCWEANIQYALIGGRLVNLLGMSVMGD